MVEWRVEEAIEEEAPRPPKPPRHRVGWRAVLVGVGILVLAGVVAIVVLRWREVLAERMIEEDLLTAIRAEERARRFGQAESTAQFIPADTPANWRARFTRTFTPTLSTADPLPVEISLVSVTLQRQGQEAEVLAQVGQQVQERRYRLTAQGWQRIPVFAEARGGTMTIWPETMQLSYQTADHDFATALYEDLPALQTQIQAWGGNVRHLIVEIHSEEFYPPAYYVNYSSTYRLSSPRLVTLPAHWDMTGEEAVRYRFAKVLWNTVPDDGISNRRLPGAGRFVLAAQTVLSLRWAVSDETYQGFVEHWRTLQPPRISNALYSRPTHTGWMDIFAPTSEEAATLLLVNTIYDTSGAEGFAPIFEAMSTAEDWDTVLQPITGMTTRQLLAATVGESSAASAIPPVVTGSPTLSEGWGSRYYEIESNTPSHVWIERTSASEVVVNNLEGLPEECAVLFSEVTVEGTWREEGLRLRAEKYRTTGDLLPLSPAPAMPPTDTQMYVSRMGNIGIFPSYGQFDAVRADGTTATLWEGRPLAFEALNGDTTVMPQGITVAKFPGPACQEVVFYRWEPDGGIVGAWIAGVDIGLSSISVWWDSHRNQGVLTRTLYNAVDTETWYWWLHPEQPILKREPDGRIPGGPVVALRPDSTQVVLADAEQNTITLYDLTRRAIVWERDYRSAETFQGIALDPAGKFLYVGEIRYGVNAGSTITRYGLDTGQYTELAEFGNPFAPYALQIDAFSSTVYAIVERNALFSLIAINDEGVHTVYNYAPEEHTYHFIACEGGGALLVTYPQPRSQNDIFAPQIRRIAPDGTLQSNVLPMNEFGFPLLCD